MANIGYTVIGAWKNLNHKYYEDLNTSPHFVTVRPGEELSKDNCPIVANVGRSPNDKLTALQAFGESRLPDVRWFYNSRQEFRVYMDDIEMYSWRKE